MGQSLEKIKFSCMYCTDTLSTQEVDLNYSDQGINEKFNEGSITDEVIVFESPVHLYENSHTQSSFFNINASKDSESSTSYFLTHEKLPFPNRPKDSFHSEKTNTLLLDGNYLPIFKTEKPGINISRHKSRSSNFSQESLNLVDSVRNNIS